MPNIKEEQLYYQYIFIIIFLDFFSVKQVDFFDDGIMEKVQAELTYITDLTQIDLNGSSNSATFHSCVSPICQQ